MAWSDPGASKVQFYRRLRRWTQIRAYLTPASLEHTGNCGLACKLDGLIKFDGRRKPGYSIA